VGELADKAGIEAHTFDEALKTPEEFWSSDGVLGGGAGARGAAYAACDLEMHLLCEACVPAAKGRFECPACKPAPRGHSGQPPDRRK